jgi:hypothetical protein
MLTRDEKKKLVIELSKKGIPWDEISDKVNMSNREISEMIKEYDPSKRKLSPRTKALNLFASGNTILEVIIALDMPYEEARIAEGQYLAIQNRGKLAELYDKYENKDYVSLVMKLSSLLKENNVGFKGLEDLIFYSRQVPELQKLFNSLNYEVSRQKLKKSAVESEMSKLILTKERQSTNLSQIKSQLFSMQCHNDELTTYELQLKAKIATQKNLVQMGDNKIRQIIQTQFDKIFGEYGPILGIIFLCVIEHIRKSQDRELFKYLFESDNAKSQNTEYLRFNDKLSQMVKEICISFKMVLSNIAENQVINHQPKPLSPDKENIKISS